MSHHVEYERAGGKLISPATVVLAGIVFITFCIIAYRFIFGLGPVSNMSDGYPWGIWLGYDVAIGSAFACGGYAMAYVCYIANGWKYHSMIRSAILASMFGYILAGLSVMVDIGRYWNAYGFFMPSRMQINSVMLEVGLCIMAYCTVLLIEFAPVVLEKFQEFKPDNIARRIAEWVMPKLDKIMIFIVVLGMTLPTMHQSSLGSLFIASGTQLHPLWQTNLLPLLFLINAFMMGFAIVFFESGLSSAGFKRPYEMEVLGLTKVIPVVIAIWLVVRFVDLAVRGQLGAIFTSGAMSGAFIVEIACLVAAFILFRKKLGPRAAFYAGMLLCIGGGLYRFNVYITGFSAGPGFNTYFPSFVEFFVTFGFVALEILGYIILARLLKILPKPHASAH